MKNINISLYDTEFLISMRIWESGDDNFKYCLAGRVSNMIKIHLNQQVTRKFLGDTSDNVDVHEVKF